MKMAPLHSPDRWMEGGDLVTSCTLCYGLVLVLGYAMIALRDMEARTEHAGRKVVLQSWRRGLLYSGASSVGGKEQRELR